MRVRCSKCHHEWRHHVPSLVTFDEFTDTLNCGLDKLMNYYGGGEVLAAARDEIQAMRALIRAYRGEEE